jgi:hypothetical protein
VIGATWPSCRVRITNTDSTIVAGLGRRERGTVYLKRDGNKWDSGFGENAAAGVLAMGIVVCEFVCGNARERKLMGSNGGVRRERRGNVRLTQVS